MRASGGAIQRHGIQQAGPRRGRSGRPGAAAQARAGLSTSTSATCCASRAGRTRRPQLPLLGISRSEAYCISAGTERRTSWKRPLRSTAAPASGRCRALHYNLGNALYERGSLAEAIDATVRRWRSSWHVRLHHRMASRTPVNGDSLVPRRWRSIRGCRKSRQSRRGTVGAGGVEDALELQQGGCWPRRPAYTSQFS
jgi:hypothetical protein